MSDIISYDDNNHYRAACVVLILTVLIFTAVRHMEMADVHHGIQKFYFMLQCYSMTWETHFFFQAVYLCEIHIY